MTPPPVNESDSEALSLQKVPLSSPPPPLRRLPPFLAVARAALECLRPHWNLTNAVCLFQMLGMVVVRHWKLYGHQIEEFIPETGANQAGLVGLVQRLKVRSHVLLLPSPVCVLPSLSNSLTFSFSPAVPPSKPFKRRIPHTVRCNWKGTHSRLGRLSPPPLPSSVVLDWMAEHGRWCGGLTVPVLHGFQREEDGTEKCGLYCRILKTMCDSKLEDLQNQVRGCGAVAVHPTHLRPAPPPPPPPFQLQHMGNRCPAVMAGTESGKGWQGGELQRCKSVVSTPQTVHSLSQPSTDPSEGGWAGRICDLSYSRQQATERWTDQPEWSARSRGPGSRIQPGRHASPEPRCGQADRDTV